MSDEALTANPECADCGLFYVGTAWADFVVPDNVWAQLVKADGVALLCVTCMIRRAVSLGIECPQGRFTSGPFSSSAELTRLSSEVAALRKALEPFAKAGDEIQQRAIGMAQREGGTADDAELFIPSSDVAYTAGHTGKVKITYGDLRAASRALATASDAAQAQMKGE